MPFRLATHARKLVVVPSRVTLVLLVLALTGVAQEREGEILGSVEVGERQPVSNAQVAARQRSGRVAVQLATTAADGTYELRRLPHGIYNLTITADGCRSTEVHDTQLDGATVRLPGVPLEIDLVADCGRERPAYYRVSRDPVSLGAIGGVIISDRATPVGNATVMLYMKGKGRIGSKKTGERGNFRFAALQIRSEEYWVSVEHEGFFPEEVRHLFVFPGLESVYSPITMESCARGHCQPHLKTIRVLPTCE